MRQIDNLSVDTDQITTVVLDDGSAAEFEFVFRPAIQRWTMTLTYGSRVIRNIGLCQHFNLLRPWRAVIPFGLSVVSLDQGDPIKIDDFSSGRVAVYVLSQDEVNQLEEDIVGTVAL